MKWTVNIIYNNIAQFDRDKSLEEMTFSVAFKKTMIDRDMVEHNKVLSLGVQTPGFNLTFKCFCQFKNCPLIFDLSSTIEI